ncbi:RNA polymerase sigma factor [Marinilabilia sp.]|uniref:RNA polymerase sigma factor n=1 Tax=Marinilabilia sp. TaxID=2021252 RepID=UPI0025C37392|nr:RNA polymerase sigma factor [Marinilabilia sp.]
MISCYLRNQINEILMQPDDKKILYLAQKANKKDEALALLMKKYKERLYWHIRKMIIVHEDADDLLQNTFMKAWNHIGNFRGDASLYTWLYRIATNETLNYINKKKEGLLHEDADIETMLGNKIETDPLFTGDEIQKRLQKCLLALPEKQRLVFNMKYFEDMTYEQMSEILGTSVGALKASYFHAVRKIEAFIKNEVF